MLNLLKKEDFITIIVMIIISNTFGNWLNTLHLPPIAIVAINIIAFIYPSQFIAKILLDNHDNNNFTPKKPLKT